MQGQRGNIGSLPEILDIDHASSSRSAAMGHQLCWNNLRSPSETQLSSFMLPPRDSLINSRQNWHGSSSVECSSSSSSQPNIGIPEWKLENGWPSSVGFSGGLVQHPEDRHQSTSIGDFGIGGVDVNLLPIQSSNLGWNPPCLNLNGGHNSDNSLAVELPIVPPVDQVDSEMHQLEDFSGNSRNVHNEINGRGVGSSDVRLRRLPCKRKSLEGQIGPSSVSPDSHFRQGFAGSELRAIPTSCSIVSGASLPEWADPILHQSTASQVMGTSHSFPNSGVRESAENSHRNSRLRIISSIHGGFTPSTSCASRVALGNEVASTSQSSGFTPIDHPVDLPFLPVSSDVAAHRPPVVLNVPASAYARHSSASVFSGNTGVAVHDLASSSRNMRNDLGRPVYVPPIGSRPLVQNSASRSVTDGSNSLPGNAAYSSGNGLVPPMPPISASSHPNMGPPDPFRHPQYHRMRRPSEHVHQSLLASPGSVTVGESSQLLHHSHGHGCPTSSQDAMVSTGLVNQGHRRSSSRIIPWMERRADSAMGIPYYVRHSASAGDGRRRLVSEIWNALDLMRRREGLRIEDIMILDPSIFFGVADLHDRHRDMRLDVDNMSYEELLALEERIGNVSTGVSEETILSRLKQRKFAPLTDHEGEGEPCCICQEGYASGEDTGALDCGHEFHTGCIKQWLTHKNLCPICKTTGLAT